MMDIQKDSNLLYHHQCFSLLQERSWQVRGGSKKFCSGSTCSFKAYLSTTLYTFADDPASSAMYASTSMNPPNPPPCMHHSFCCTRQREAFWFEASSV